MAPTAWKSSDFISRAFALVRRTHRHEMSDEDATEKALREAYNAGRERGRYDEAHGLAHVDAPFTSDGGPK